MEAFKRYHLVKNFPKNYPFHKKVIANIIFFFTGIIIHPRKNQLTKADHKKAKKTLRKGDIILAGNLRTLLHSIINEPVTHSAFYEGNKKFIHSMADGVQYISLYKIFLDYDTLVILRMPRIKKRKETIKKVIKWIEKQHGKPYDFEFNKKHQAFFCTELVNDSFKAAGYNTGLTSIKRPRKVIEKLEKQVTGAVEALKPINFMNSKFKIVYLSHNLKIKNKKLVYVAQ